MTERIFNFSAGPAVLPVPVLEEAQRDMLSLPGVGMSVMEISHRSKTFDAIVRRAESGVRKLLKIADASSDILSRAIPVEKYALIYAGAQKNIGPSGVTLVIIRDDLLPRIPDG